MGLSYANLTLRSKKDGIYLVYSVCKNADKGQPEKETVVTKMNNADVYLRVQVTNGGKCNFYYSTDGNSYTKTGEEFTAEVGRWIGAKVGIFCTRETQTNDSGWADFDWFRVEPLQ
jgi:hypothetical protein